MTVALGFLGTCAAFYVAYILIGIQARRRWLPHNRTRHRDAFTIKTEHEAQQTEDLLS